MFDFKKPAYSSVTSPNSFSTVETTTTEEICDEDIRLICLKLAVQCCENSSEDSIIHTAKKFEIYVKGEQ